MATATVPSATYTIASLPRNAAALKTLQRLMRLEPSVQRGLSRLAKRRGQTGNTEHQRGGRMWTSRIRATKLVAPRVGERFTVELRPQILPDLRSVERYLTQA
ncbi:MAG TPA: hypothetical protein PKC43_02735 [Phycisphaerales bacterium]|nr:hypothetical protein [Phycisphaerales bacterium]HMP36342.1 hypothetical protein [Phycisphaerales bacterium]